MSELTLTDRVAGPDDTGPQDHARPSSQHLDATALDSLFKEVGLDAKGSRPFEWIAQIGALIREARTRLGKKQDELAAAIDVQQPYLSKLENGVLSSKGPTVGTLLRVAEALDCEIVVSFRDRHTQLPLGEVIGNAIESEAGIERPAAWLSPREREILNVTIEGYTARNAITTVKPNVVLGKGLTVSLKSTLKSER